MSRAVTLTKPGNRQAPTRSGSPGMKRVRSVIVNEMDVQTSLGPITLFD